jgi:hypothetical protein
VRWTQAALRCTLPGDGPGGGRPGTEAPLNTLSVISATSEQLGLVQVHATWTLPTSARQVYARLERAISGTARPRGGAPARHPSSSTSLHYCGILSRVAMISINNGAFGTIQEAQKLPRPDATC